MNMNTNNFLTKIGAPTLVVIPTNLGSIQLTSNGYARVSVKGSTSTATIADIMTPEDIAVQLQINGCGSIGDIVGAPELIRSYGSIPSKIINFREIYHCKESGYILLIVWVDGSKSKVSIGETAVYALDAVWSGVQNNAQNTQQPYRPQQSGFDTPNNVFNTPHHNFSGGQFARTRETAFGGTMPHPTESRPFVNTTTQTVQTNHHQFTMLMRSATLSSIVGVVGRLANPNSMHHHGLRSSEQLRDIKLSLHAGMSPTHPTIEKTFTPNTHVLLLPVDNMYSYVIEFSASPDHVKAMDSFIAFAVARERVINDYLGTLDLFTSLSFSDTTVMDAPYLEHLTNDLESKGLIIQDGGKQLLICNSRVEGSNSYVLSIANDLYEGFQLPVRLKLPVTEIKPKADTRSNVRHLAVLGYAGTSTVAVA